MKKLLLLPGFVFSVYQLWAQPSAIYTDPDRKLKQAEWYFDHEQYTLALPLLQDLDKGLQTPAADARSLTTDDIHYYLYACELMDDEGAAVTPAKAFINSVDNQARAQQLSFCLGEYYFRRRNMGEAQTYLENAGIDNLTNDQASEEKFELGYAYFLQNQFDKAKPLFNAVRQVPKDPHAVDASYYYGFIAYTGKQYNEALACFRVAEGNPAYQGTVPFYEAEIYYFLGEKDSALAKGVAMLQAGANPYYSVELNRLVGHLYFERKDFRRALPYLETYMNGSQKIRREELYEISYCYYVDGQYDKCIAGFKQLSDRTDSLSQSSMYLLGDAYLKTGQKANARSAFSFCADNSSYPLQKEVSLFNYGKLSYELGYQNEALTALKKYLANYPSSGDAGEARELLVSLLANSSNYREALALLESIPNPAESTKRLFPRVLYGRAVELINDQQLGEAADLLDSAIQAPYNEQVVALAYFWKGELAYRAGKYDEAIRDLVHYAQSGQPTQGDASPIAARYDLGYSCFQKEAFGQALGYFQQITRRVGPASTPLEQDAYVRVGDCYYMMREYGKAQQVYDAVIADHLPGSDYALYQKAMISGISNGTEKVKLLEGLSRQYPGSNLVSESNMEIAGTLLSEEHFAQAVPYLNLVAGDSDALSMQPRAHLQLAICYYNLGKAADALSQYKLLVQQFPNSPEAEQAMDNIKSIYIEEGHPADYIAYAKTTGKSISVNEEDSLTYAAAQVQYDNGNCTAATARFSDYITKFPQGGYQLPAHFYSAECLSGQKKWPDALADYDYVVAQGSSPFGERSAAAASRIAYFELKQYQAAAGYFARLKDWATSDQNRLEALRGLLRSYFELERYDSAAAAARDLLSQKGLNSDDKALSDLVSAKNDELSHQYDPAIQDYRSVIQLNKGEWAAQARYEIAYILYTENNTSAATEKAAFEVINKSGSYDKWVTKAYLLLGDVYFARKDYFNAQATFQSIAENSTIPELKQEAQQKLEAVKQAQAQGSKVDTAQ